MFDTLREYHAFRQSLAYDGTCNALPKFEPRFNPIGGDEDSGCRLHPDFNEEGLGSGASYGKGVGLEMPDFASG
eukprot:CAMPEP_0184290164 /NCGR_PEP_ID=MMETSP1049-20130417/2505_1 /TAXON_ID=77928 /ORGANISM="Proteomonas sulcata, Strain CCMP704" /LENGTH=73 /DNA_ID=CAMNT_0026597259 /DNA_START=78 /DNA_END=299 /DNA_ORIENTATION=+